MSRRDVFGKAILDASKGKKVAMAVRRDDSRLDEEDVSHYFTNFDQFPKVEQKAMSLTEGLVLDVGCGAGRHSLYLQTKGLDVIALDISRLAIRVAHQRGIYNPIQAAAPLLPFKNQTFSTILLMFNNFGILGGYQETIIFLKELKRILKPNGIILASSIHATLTTNKSHLKYHEMNRKRGLPPGLVKIRLEYNGETGEWFKLLLASPDEMKMLSTKAELELAKTIGPVEGAYYVGIIKKS
jgi:SAM-dependent methyltransferase